MVVTVEPTTTVWLVGCSVITGGIFVTVKIALELVTDPALFVTMTV